MKDLALAPWHSLANTTDPNEAWNVWKFLSLYICDFHAPYQQKNVRNSKSPWLTLDIKKLMIVLASRVKTNENWKRFKAMRNKVTTEIKRA